MPNTKFHFERFEFKYILNPIQAREIEYDLLGGHLVYDPFIAKNSVKGYWINSIYFDSPDLFCYHDKINGIRDRFKIRLRTYHVNWSDYQNSFLEIKRKNDAVVVKDRVILRPDARISDHDLTGIVHKGNFHGGREAVLDEIAYKIRKYTMSSKIISKYFRRPLVGRLNEKLRVTFDGQIQTGVFHGLKNPTSTYLLRPNLTIMEIKYNNTLPDWLHRVIMKHNLSRSPFSKYCEGMKYLVKHRYF